MAKIEHIKNKRGEIIYPVSKEGAIYDENGVLLSTKIATFITRLVDNLANYYLKSETYTKAEVDELIGAIQSFTYIVVSELPTASAETMGKIYLVPSADPQTQNVKDEYITIRSGVEGSYTYSWEQIGSTAIDLSGYVTTEALNTALAAYTTTANLTTLLAGKQDTISDLSTIRSGAAAGATAYQKPGTGIPSTDMASGVQTSLGKADSAYQKPSGGIPKTDLESGVQGSLELADSAVQADPIGSIVPPVDPSEFATKEEVEGLEAKVSNITAEETESENKEIVILDDNDAEVVKVTENGLSAKSLKVGATPVLTENDQLQAGENITIVGNVISADFPYETESSSSIDEEQVWENDGGTETYAKINKDGIHAKEFYDLEGHTIDDKIEEAISGNEVARVCNTKYNHSALAPFINKYIAKEVDEWNQLTLMMCGDSIFGRQHSGATEMSPTLDVNTPDSTAIGYETGHFPPNMWVQNVPFKVLQALQFDEADVKYYNHTASEVTKAGSGWTDMFPAGADELRTVKTNVLGDSISIHFTGAYFAKVVISKYYQTSHLANVKVTVSENGGQYVSPEQLGLTESHAHSNSGEYELRDFETIKFAQLVFGGFDTAKTYDLKVELTNSNYLNVWGFETWTRKRLNVVVSAEGGNVASSQTNNPKRFYNENLNPDLCILNMPFLNDCGTSYWYAWYNGKKVPTSAAIDTPNQYDFIYCDEAGTYTNFGGIVAVKGDYIEYDGNSWVLGSTKLNNMLNTYRTDLHKLMVMCKNIGVPMLVLMTHQSSIFIGKPFLDDAADFMKLNAKEVGFAAIDVYKYRKDLNLTNIWSDGTHLNDNGVQMYIDLISAVLNKDAEYVADGMAVIETGSFAGHSNGGNTSFGFIMKETPKVFLSNPSVSVASVSKSGFNVSGNGSYDYYVKS